MNLRVLFIAAHLLLCLILSAGAVPPQDVFPTVSFSWDGVSIYTYHVSVPANNSYPFGQLLIFTQSTSWNGSEETWEQQGAVVGGIDQAWLCGFSEGDLGDTAEWRATGDQEAVSSWEGDFILTAPGTSPVQGQGMTKDGGLNSVHYFDIQVPGPVPEPSSLLALGSMIGLAIPIIRRRRR